MYKQRLHVSITFCIVAVLICIGRLGYLQFFGSEDARDQIKKSRILPAYQIPTLRGSILDRNGNELAKDKPVFYLKASYQLTRLLDERFWRGEIVRRMDEDTSEEMADQQLREKYEDDLNDLMGIIEKCIRMKNVDTEQIEQEIHDINDDIWKMRQYFAWVGGYPESPLNLKRKAGERVYQSQAIAEFEQLEPDEDKRLLKIMKIDLAEMYDSYGLIELQTQEDLLTAQLEFVDIEGVEISPEAKRVYPYRSAACQIIGWVGSPRDIDREIFVDDKYSTYQQDDVSGSMDGVEKVCEVILRGKRGERQYDKDGRLLGYKETIFGRDVELTLDIELQQQIERLITDPNQNPIAKNAIAPTGVVVMDVATGDILAMASLPVYDVNTARKNYNKLNADKEGRPLLSKTIRTNYPPGSVIKPVILIAGLEEKKIKARDVISCPGHNAPKGWPNCMQWRAFGGSHNAKWQGEGGNIARNAIRGSCNVYFSILADRLDAKSLQNWLLKFGFGKKILPGPAFDEKLAGLERTKGTDRNLRQSAGRVSSFDQKISGVMPSIAKWDKRFFGIGQGNLRVTVLHVANAIAAIARGGIYKHPRLFSSKDDPLNEYQEDMEISPATIAVVRDGMYAVANEEGGTAFKRFKDSVLHSRDIRIYGKTGSTENPNHAWFAGFAEDKWGRTLSIAVVVEGGEGGSTDAAPLANKILIFCNEAGYLGKSE